ncbi:MAG: hypothetical protein JST54_21495 [Deltaproteobacteria bacterium]|nr:hypothetical protein [Deltaproteobacteria bacterium]
MTSPRGASPPESLRARILQSVALEPPSPTRSHRARRAAWLLLTCCAVVGLELLLLLGPQSAGPPLGGPWSTLAWGLGALLLAATVGRRGDDALGPPEWALWVVSAMALLVPGWIALKEGAGGVGQGGPALESLEAALALGLPGLLAILVARAESDPTHPEAQGAAWGALSGCLSSLLVGAAFPLRSAADIALGQLLPAALQVGIGSSLGAELLDACGSPHPSHHRRAVGGVVGLWLGCIVWIHAQRASPLQLSAWQPPEMILTIALGILAGEGLGLRLRRKPG